MCLGVPVLWRPGVCPSVSVSRRLVVPVSLCLSIQVSRCLGVPASGSQCPSVPVSLCSGDADAQPAFIQQARAGHQCSTCCHPVSQTGAPMPCLLVIQQAGLGHQRLTLFWPNYQASQTSTPMLNLFPSASHTETPMQLPVFI